MKSVLLTILLLFISQITYSQTFTIDDKGIVKCPNAKVGDKGTISGDTYEAVDNDLLRQRRDQGVDMRKVCTSLVTNMSDLFLNKSFNQAIGNWDMSKVTDVSFMFFSSPFNQAIENWDLSKVTSMRSMFAFSQFNQAIGSWSVGKVTDMNTMFYKSQFNQPIGNWNVSMVENMTEMFSGTPFNQNISQWCVFNLKTEPEGFSSQSPLTSQNKPVWGVCLGFPLKTNLTKPSNNITESIFKTVFEWDTIKDASKYQVQVTEGTTTVVVDTLISVNTLTQVISLKSKTLHSWRVRGYNESKNYYGEWSNVWKFTTQDIAIPSPSLPANGASDVSGQIDLFWSNTPNEASYQVQVSGVSTFSPLFFENTNATTNTVKLPNFIAENPATFYWRVRSKLDSGETGEWSEVWSFTRARLTTDGDTNEIPIQYSLDQNFPNPFNPTTNITFSLPSTVHTRLEVLNVLGQPVYMLVNQTMGRGTHTVSFDGGSLSSGIYLYRLTTPEFTQTRVMSLVK